MTTNRLLRATLRRAAFLHDRRGVAAVEFALILPLLLTMYLGSAELTEGIMASRKVNWLSRSLSDLVAQQPNGSALTDAQVNDIFAAGTAMLAPFSATPLQMTLTSVEFVANGAKSTGYDAKPRWSVTRSGSQRPCAILTPVANNNSPTPTSLPSGVYGAGSIIVADVSYTYDPPFGGAVLQWSTSQSSLTFGHTTFMKPRNTTLIAYSGSAGKVCPTY